ncbi:MAG: hypothetical protein HY443_01400 [Candidatus Nealsonbacteria bacterium]|nr:hypothetical protein [Candidatus Nealsonbacteria bacterium]
MRGQSLVELLIALGVFVVAVGIAVSLLIAGYFPGLQARENSLALVLAEEGMENARMTRDADWDGLDLGVQEEDVSSKLSEGKRKTVVESAGTDRKKVTLTLSWKSFLGQDREVELKTYLTNWQRHSD